MILRLAHDRRGATVVEFALVAPTFLMFLFLLLDGGRMLFTKQAVNELAAAAARCAALKPTVCADQAGVKDWAVTRGRSRSRLNLVSNDVVVDAGATCNGQPSARVTVNAPYRKGTMMLLPQAAVPAVITSSACFPRAA